MFLDSENRIFAISSMGFLKKKSRTSGAGEMHPPSGQPKPLATDGFCA
jgi:hypothetical protein